MMVGGVEKLAFLWGTPECISLRPFLLAIKILQMYSKVLVLHTYPICETKKVKKARGDLQPQTRNLASGR